MPLPGAYLDLVRDAATAIKPHVARTPLVLSRFYGERLGFPVYLKLESLQVTGAFKIRGATNKVLALKAAGADHVITASSGSHAMGVSLAARTFGLKATIVMPETSPELKRKKVLAYGADLVIRGRNFDDSRLVALDLAERTGAAMVSGTEDELVMAGHGTIGLEILEDLPGVDFVAMPVGGAGAIAGVLMALRGAAGQRAGIRVWGVQSEGAPSMKVSLERGQPTELPRIDTIADAIAVRCPGLRAFELVRELGLDGFTTVTDDQMIRTIGLLALQDKIVAEPASAAPLAVDWRAVLGDGRAEPASLPRAAVFIITGGNVAPSLLRQAIAAAEEP